MLTKRLTTIPQGSRPQAIGGRNARSLQRGGCDIVSSAWRHAAAAKRVAGERVAPPLKIMSADWCVGVPFNIAFYALLLRVCSRLIGRPEGGLHITFGDAHLYEMHIEGAVKQLEQAQEVRKEGKVAPHLMFRHYGITHEPAAAVFRSLEPLDFELVGYDPMPAIKLGVAV